MNALGAYLAARMKEKTSRVALAAALGGWAAMLNGQLDWRGAAALSIASLVQVLLKEGGQDA